mgnify:CR=1 FL=1
MDYAFMGAAFRKARQKKNLSMKQVADAAGICLSFYGHIERGTRKASLETALNISQVLEVSLDLALRLDTATQLVKMDRSVEAARKWLRKALNELN